MQTEPVAWALMKTHSFAGHAIDIRRMHARRTVASEIAVADVVGKDEHDVGEIALVGGFRSGDLRLTGAAGASAAARSVAKAKEIATATKASEGRIAKRQDGCNRWVEWFMGEVWWL